MSDLIERQKALEALNGKLNAFAKDPKYVVEYLDGVRERILQLPSAKPERKIYAEMPDAEFEKWLHDNGICNPTIHESIPCSCVPLLIDSAINEMPSAEPEWIPVSERLPERDDRYLITTFGIFKREYVEMAGFNTASKTWTQYDLEYGYVQVDDVIAWMPMPEPYKAGESE